MQSKVLLKLTPHSDQLETVGMTYNVSYNPGKLRRLELNEVFLGSRRVKW